MVRSYSCISGMTSEDRETGTPGSSSAAISASRCSWAALVKLLISDTVNASMPRAARERNAVLAASSSRGSTTEPSAPIRSGTSTVHSSGAMGSDLL